MSCGPSSVMSGSMSDVSMTWPRPVCSRSRSAIMIANAVASAATPSASPNGGSVGGPSGSPVSAAKPLIASASVPKPGAPRVRPDLAEAGHARDARGRGLRPCSSSGPRPQRSSVPGRKFSISTSAPLGQAQEEVGAVGLREVERDRPLVAPERLPPQRDAVLARAVPARRVAARRVLDLDHVGAVVAEERRGERAANSVAASTTRMPSSAWPLMPEGPVRCQAP